MENENDNFHLLKSLCENNLKFFKNDRTEKGICFQNTFQELIDHLLTMKFKTEKVEDFADDYDFDYETPGNGYKSFISIVNSAIIHAKNVCENIADNRNKYFFRKSFYLKEIIACKELFTSLCTCLDYLLILHEWSEKGDLFPKDNHTTEELFEMSEKINQYCFYGRCACFQYTESMKNILRGLSICMASYSESYFSKSNRVIKTTSSAWTSSKYFLNPELRAKRIVNISHSANINFCKSFWFLAESEIMHTLPCIFGSTVEINKVIKIPPEPLQMEIVETGELINIPIPRSHTPPGSISVRLISSKRRDGMIGVLANKKSFIPASKNLLIHCHGGGFVAQSSKSHELYLRDWAVFLDCPILSIDYSLAPEAPYPRALEEVFYVYCWALRNSNLLGTTAQKIVLAGDSAGANLCTVTVFKCIDFGLRKPDGLFMAYCPVYIDFIPSPARMLCLMDPLLPFGFLIRCMKAYASVDEKAVEAKEQLSMSSFQNRLEVNLSACSSFTNINDTKSNNKSRSFGSDEASDTFASASFHSQILENTELLSPDMPSSCISFEEDSQPIMKLSAETLSNISTPPKDSENNVTTALLTELNQYSSHKTLSEENIVLEVGKDILNPRTLQGRFQRAATDFVERLSAALKSLTNSSEIESEYSEYENKECLKNIDVLIARNPLIECNFNVPKNIYISPYIAPDEYLKQMPPTSILTTDLDPCLDDGVMFAKRLKKVGISVKLDVLKGLSHGFLNFTMLSKDANDGSKTCANRIADLFNGL